MMSFDKMRWVGLMDNPTGGNKKNDARSFATLRPCSGQALRMTMGLPCTIRTAQVQGVYFLIVLVCSLIINVNPSFSASTPLPIPFQNHSSNTSNTIQQPLEQMQPVEQRNAVHELGTKGDSSSVRRLIDILKNIQFDSSVRAAAAIELGKFPDAYNALYEFKNASDLNFRQSVLLSLYQLKPETMKIRDIAEVLNSGTNENRERLMDYFPAEPGNELNAAILKMLTDCPQSYTIIQTSTSYEIYLIEYMIKYKPILNYLKNTSRNDSVMHALTKILDNRNHILEKMSDISGGQVQSVGSSSSSSTSRRTISSSSSNAGTTLRSSYDYANTDVFSPVLDVLKEWYCKESAASISHLASTMKVEKASDEELVKMCIHALAAIGGKESVDGLKNIINYVGKENLRIEAINALPQISGDDAKDVLIKLSDTTNEHIKTAAQNAISRIDRGDKSDISAGPARNDQSTDKNADSTVKQKEGAKPNGPFPALSPEQQIDKIKDLEAKADNQAIEKIIAFLDSSDAGVRKQAANSLGHLKATEAIAKLTDLANNDPDAGVKQAAKFALLLIKK